MDIDFKDRLFSVIEAADHLRISRAYLYQLMSQKRLRPVKFGKRTVFKGSELRRFVDAAAAR